MVVPDKNRTAFAGAGRYWSSVIMSLRGRHARGPCASQSEPFQLYSQAVSADHSGQTPKMASCVLCTATCTQCILYVTLKARMQNLPASHKAVALQPEGGPGMPMERWRSKGWGGTSVCHCCKMPPGQTIKVSALGPCRCSGCAAGTLTAPEGAQVASACTSRVCD